MKNKMSQLKLNERTKIKNLIKVKNKMFQLKIKKSRIKKIKRLKLCFCTKNANHNN